MANRGRSHSTNPGARALGRPGGRQPADLSPGCSPVARAAEVSAESGHSLGRRGEGREAGAPAGGSAGSGNRQTSPRDRASGKAGSIRTRCHKQQMQCTPGGHGTQQRGLFLFFFKESQDVEPQHECHPSHTDTHDTVISPSLGYNKANTQTHTHK